MLSARVHIPPDFGRSAAPAFLPENACHATALDRTLIETCCRSRSFGQTCNSMLSAVAFGMGVQFPLDCGQVEVLHTRLVPAHLAEALPSFVQTLNRSARSANESRSRAVKTDLLLFTGPCGDFSWSGASENCFGQPRPGSLVCLASKADAKFSASAELLHDHDSTRPSEHQVRCDGTPLAPFVPHEVLRGLR